MPSIEEKGTSARHYRKEPSDSVTLYTSGAYTCLDSEKQGYVAEGYTRIALAILILKNP